MPSGTLTGLTFDDIDLSATLSSGQVFRFTQDINSTQQWRGVIENTHLITLEQHPETAAILWEGDGDDCDEAAVRRFLRLDDLDLPALAQEWTKRDPYFAEAWGTQPGVRLLRQDPHECFFSFLCASVAPIKRISGMVCSMAPAGEVFPNATALSQISESELRTRGLGFRATRVSEAAKRLSQEYPPDYLHSLRPQSHAEVQKTLTEFHGVGRKIADCVALFSMDKDEAVPVDVHIWRMAQNRYAPQLKGKSLTATHYQLATEAFHRVFGEKAGWAQQILFYRVAVGNKETRPPVKMSGKNFAEPC